MRAVVQRVSGASVGVGSELVAQIGGGLLVLVGVAQEDTAADAEYLAGKIVELRIFEDDAGKMNRSLAQAGGAVLAVSQFTLIGDCRKGRRPSFSHAAAAQLAQRLFDLFVTSLRTRNIAVQTGRFGEHMEVNLTNDGPVTLLLDSRRLF